MGVLLGPLIGSRFLGKSYKAIPEELEQDPCNYDEAINDIVSRRWLDAMKAEMESMYSMLVLWSQSTKIDEINWLISLFINILMLFFH